MGGMAVRRAWYAPEYLRRAAIQNVDLVVAPGPDLDLTRTVSMPTLDMTHLCL